MKKTICSAAIFLLAFTSTALAQKKLISQTIMTISWNNTSKAISITNAAYTFSKPESDSAPAAYLSVTAENVDTFLLKAASRRPIKSLSVSIKNYDSTGRLSHTILLKNAKISFLSGMLGTGEDPDEEPETSADIGIQSDDITVDGVAL